MPSFSNKATGCSFPACDRQAYGKGLCKAHWQQRSRGQALHQIGYDRRPVVESPNVPGVLLVTLTQGFAALIDEDAREAVAAHSWCVRIDKKTKVKYAQATIACKRITLHRFLWLLWGGSPSAHVDHENTDGLDCRRSNLRGATKAENNRNVGVRRTSKSGLKGVSFNARLGRWVAWIAAENRSHYLGSFSAPEEAAAAYADAAPRFHGAFARTF